MNTNLENILVKTLEKASNVGGEIYDATKDGLIQAVDFAKEQIPDVIQQILSWEFYYHAIYAFILLILSGLFLYVSLKFWRKSWEFTCDQGFPYVLANCAGLAIGLSIFTFGTVGNTMDCVKIKVAPKVFLIDYCSDLIQAKKATTLPNGRLSYYRQHNH
jgi:hypothetical protein